MPSFYLHEAGAALSVTIDKYNYVSLQNVKHSNVKFIHDEIYEVDDVNDMKHEITRETLKYFDINDDITITSVSDITAKGSGLGSSSAFTVGLVNAMSHYKYGHDYSISASKLAKTACNIEIDRCKFPIGKQDQYAAAYGGFNLFEFEPSDDVAIREVVLKPEVEQKFQNNLILVYSGKGRSANKILQKQQSLMDDAAKFDLVRKSMYKAYEGAELLRGGYIDDFGRLLHEAWMDKKRVVAEISHSYFDEIYENCIDAGALGGKLLGAGGGGFFLFYVKPEYKDSVVRAILKYPLCKIYDFKFVHKGSVVTTI